MRWRLRTRFGDDIGVVLDGEPATTGATVRVPSLFLRFELRAWLMNHMSPERSTLLDMYRTLQPAPLDPAHRTAGHAERYVLPVLDDAFERGRLIAFKLPRPAIIPVLGEPDAPPSPAPPPPAPDTPLTWVEVELRDDDNHPVSAAFKIELANGEVRQGHTGSDGKSRIDGIKGGSAKVTFTDLPDPCVVPA